MILTLVIYAAIFVAPIFSAFFRKQCKIVKFMIIAVPLIIAPKLREMIPLEFAPSPLALAPAVIAFMMFCGLEALGSAFMNFSGFESTIFGQLLSWISRNIESFVRQAVQHPEMHCSNIDIVSFRIKNDIDTMTIRPKLV